MYYSVRMRSAKGGAHEAGGTHISGAERLLTQEKVEKEIDTMIKRAFNHSKGKADFIQLTIENISPKTVNYIKLLSIKNYQCINVEEGRKKAEILLENAGVSKQAIFKGMQNLTQLNKNMRGAMVLCCQTGKRLDDLGDRGIRVSRMDTNNEAKLIQWLKKQGYKGIHIREAIILASKVISHQDVVAELCWSDDPEYTTGYVTSNCYYQRIEPLKKYGSGQGGRVFFVRPETNINKLQQYLEKEPVFVGDWDKNNEFF